VYFAAQFDHPFTVSGSFSAANTGPAPDTRARARRRGRRPPPRS
jgi:hypothetical protein